MHINRFDEHINEDYVNTILNFAIGFSLGAFLRGLFLNYLRKRRDSNIENKLFDIVDKINNATKLPVTEFNDRYFVRLNDDEDLRIMKDQKVLIISKSHSKDIILPLTDEDYTNFLKIIKGKS